MSKETRETKGLSIDSQAKLEEALENLPQETRKIIIAGIQRDTFYQGPVMPPEMAEYYEHLVPGAAERILALTEKEQQHRHHCELGYLEASQMAVETKCWQARYGMVFGLMGLLLLVAAVLFSAYYGWHEAVIGLSAASVFGIIAHFVNAYREDSQS